MSRTERLVTAAAVVGTMIFGPARAGDVRFDPTVDLSAFHDGNVRNVDKQNTPDDGARLGLNLNLTVRNPSSSWTLAYRPFREMYKDFSERDYTGHNASVRYTRTSSERTTVNGAATYFRTERLEFDPLTPDAAVTYTPRSTYESASLRVGGSAAAGRRSSVLWGASGRMTSQEDIRDPLTQAIVTDFNDSTAADATVGWSFSNSPRSSIGTAYTFQRISYDFGPSTTVHSVAFTQNITVGRDGVVNYGIGVLRGTTGSDSSANLAVNAAYRWTTGPQSSFSAGLRQGVSEGDGVSGATLDRGGYLTWLYSRPRSWGMGLTLTYWDRGQLNGPPGAENPPSALTFSDNVSFPLGRSVRMGLFHVYRHQSATEDFASSYHSYGLFMNWAVLGERRTR